MKQDSLADVCVILEGTYPYVVGGVSSWAHELIASQSHLSFSLVSLLPRDFPPRMRFTLPPNVAHLETLHLQRIPTHSSVTGAELRRLFDRMRQPLIQLTTGKASLEEFKEILDALSPLRDRISESAMLNSEQAWELMLSMYEAGFPESSLLDYFWSWRAIMSSLYTLIIPDLPPARCYHTFNTGYGGMMAARAVLETGRPMIVTEHGIYTNERRVEIASASWLEYGMSKNLSVTHARRNLQDLWIDTFTNYSRICYEAASHIITLYTGNQEAQLADGAHPVKMRVIPNGIDLERFGKLGRRPHPRPTVALIGRVSPIKDVKNFLRSISLLRADIPDVHALVMGPLDEDEAYVAECRSMVSYFSLESNVTFTGTVKIDEYLPEIDVLVLSSISEVQPLVILEAGACGVPAVVTDVGACREMVAGRAHEHPPIHPGGVVVPLANSQALAAGLKRLLSDSEYYDACSKGMQDRVARYYNKSSQYEAYKLLYQSCMKMEHA